MLKRYETHHERLMTLYVTRQNQEFIVSGDQELVDIEIIRSSIELVGEPGYASASGSNAGTGHTHGAYDSAAATSKSQNPNYMSTMNTLYAMNTTNSSKVYGSTLPNAVVHQTHLNHGWVNVDIQGMMENRQFMQDETYQGNQLSVVLPTDSGLLPVRTAQQNGPPHSMLLENVKMQQRIRVSLDFAGTWPKEKRRARFVEDFADTDPATYRNADGTVKYYVAGALGDCQIPANMINCAIIQFKIKPRSVL